MFISFFKCKSRSEQAFRMTVCTFAAVCVALCVYQQSVRLIYSDTVRQEVLRSAFSVDKLSKNSAYRYKDIFNERELQEDLSH